MSSAERFTVAMALVVVGVGSWMLLGLLREALCFHGLVCLP
jgi:hypothetical protein